MPIHAYAAHQANAELEPFEYEPGPLGPQQVEIDVSHCGICHSDLSMLDNAWQMTRYPFVPGHEIIGTVAAVGEQVSEITRGETVGLGWFAQSCMTCDCCLSGDHNLCANSEGTIVGRHGGFADKVRAHSAWVAPLSQGLAAASAGPLLCGGVTVFNPIIQNNIQATSRVGVVGIGGLGHLALQFLQAWGCEVTAFSTNADKEATAKACGAQHFFNTHDRQALTQVANTFDMILVTVNVPLDWDAYLAALRPRGILHLVGAGPKISAEIFSLIGGQKSISGSLVGSPTTIRAILAFAARHGIAPMVETLPMYRANEALAMLRAGKPRYRIILNNAEQEKAS